MPFPRRFPAPWSVEEQPECVKSFAEQHGRMQWPRRGRNQSKERRLAKKVIKKAKKEENTEVDRSDVKPPSPFSS
jgi:hypothetical protein